MARIVGMKDLCKYERRSETTVLDLIRNAGYPAAKIRGVWEANTERIEKWRDKYIEVGVSENGYGDAAH